MVGWSLAVHWRPSTQRFALQGIDLPMTSQRIEWGFVRAAGADFAYLAATAGTRQRKAEFESDWEALPEAGLRRGAVHLFSLCEPAEDQADAFNTFVPRTDDALPPAVDIDLRDDCAAHPDRAALLDAIRRFATRVETHAGKPVIVRVSRAAEREYQLTSAVNRPIWVMGNGMEPGYAGRPWRMWRASDVRRIDGVEGPVNWDVVAP